MKVSERICKQCKAIRSASPRWPRFSAELPWVECRGWCRTRRSCNAEVPCACWDDSLGLAQLVQNCPRNATPHAPSPFPHLPAGLAGARLGNESSARGQQPASCAETNCYGGGSGDAGPIRMGNGVYSSLFGAKLQPNSRKRRYLQCCFGVIPVLH